MKSINKSKLKEYLFAFSFLAYPIILFIIFYVAVNVNSIAFAFERVTITGKRSFAGLDNFQKFFRELKTEPILKTSLLNSLKIFVLNQLIAFPLSVLFSYCLFKKFFGCSAVRFIVLVPQIVSSFVVCLVFKKFVESALPNIMTEVFGAKNVVNLITDNRYSFGTIVFYGIWISFSGSLIVYPNAMKEIPEEIMESAQLDGANNMFYELRYIILPLIAPTMTTFIITSFSTVFTSDANLVAFFMYEASGNLYNMGYYFTVKTLTGTAINYPYLSAIGIIITLFSVPVVYLVKWGLEKLFPGVEY